MFFLFSLRLFTQFEKQILQKSIFDVEFFFFIIETREKAMELLKAEDNVGNKDKKREKKKEEEKVLVLVCVVK